MPAAWFRIYGSILTVAQLGALVRPAAAETYRPLYLGCWTEAREHVIPDVDEFANHANSADVFTSCERLARNRGFMVFGVANDTRCVGSVHAQLLYMKYGPSQKCVNGTGGIGAADFYSLEASEEDQSSGSNVKKNYISGAGQVDALAQLNSDQDWTDLPPTAARHPLVIRRKVRPVVIQPLFKEIDELQYGDYEPPLPDTNILVNPSFELPLSKNPLDGWSCQGDTNDPRGGIVAQYLGHDRADGHSSGVCFARLFAWAGPGQYIGRRVKPQGAYKFRGWTRLLDRHNTGDLHTLELWIRYKKRGEKKLYKQLLAKRVKGLKNSGWVHWNTAFELPTAPHGFSFVFIYFMGPKSSLDIAADDLYLAEIYQDPDWKAESDVLIDRYRKGTVRVRVNVPRNLLDPEFLSVVKVDVEQKKHGFAFGAAINSKTLLTNKKYREFFLENFEWAVLESSLKWDVLEKREGHQDYATDDRAMELLDKYNIPVRGHCIFWASPEEVPYWVKKISSPSRLKEVLKTRLETLLGRYKGRFLQWDVNNEMLHGSFFRDRLGPTIRDWMYVAAAVADPKADLFMNDFDAVENGQLTEALLEETRDFMAREIPIDGLGLQGHFTGHVNPAVLKYRLETLSEARVPLWLTEVDILEKDPEKRADSLESVMRTSFSHPTTRGLILWSFWDSAAWRGKNVALVDGTDWKLNAAGHRYQTLLKKWTTKGTLLPYNADADGANFLFRGFHGHYVATVRLPNGRTLTREFQLLPGRSPLDVLVDFSVDQQEADVALGDNLPTASNQRGRESAPKQFILLGEAKEEFETTSRSSLAKAPTKDVGIAEPNVAEDVNTISGAELGAWTAWSSCDRSCGPADQQRTRAKCQLEYRLQSQDCTENEIEVRSCPLVQCPSA